MSSKEPNISRVPVRSVLLFGFTALLIAAIGWYWIPYQSEETFSLIPLPCILGTRGNAAFPAIDYCSYSMARIGSFQFPFFGKGWHQGILPSLLFAPLYLIKQHLFMLRLMNAMLFCAQAWVLAKAFNFRWWVVLGGLLVFFPYALQHLSDTGPVAHQTLIVILLYAVLQQWSKTCSWKWLAVACALVVSGFLVKITQLWLMPGIAGMFLYSLCAGSRLNKDVKKRLKQLLLVGSVTALFIATIFLIPNAKTGRSTFQEMTGAKTIQQGHSTGFSLGHVLESKVLPLLLNPEMGAVRAFNDRPLWTVPRISDHPYFLWIYRFLVFGFVPAGILWMLCSRSSRKWRSIEAFFYYLFFLMTVVSIGGSYGGYLAPHAVLSFPFLILATCSIIRELITSSKKSKRIIRPLFALFVFLNLTVYVTLFRNVAAHRNKAFMAPALWSAISVLRQGAEEQSYMIASFDDQRNTLVWIFAPIGNVVEMRDMIRWNFATKMRGSPDLRFQYPTTTRSRLVQALDLAHADKSVFFVTDTIDSTLSFVDPTRKFNVIPCDHASTSSQARVFKAMRKDMQNSCTEHVRRFAWLPSLFESLME